MFLGEIWASFTKTVQSRMMYLLKQKIMQDCLMDSNTISIIDEYACHITPQEVIIHIIYLFDALFRKKEKDFPSSIYKSIKYLVPSFKASPSLIDYLRYIDFTIDLVLPVSELWGTDYQKAVTKHQKDCEKMMNSYIFDNCKYVE